jgi:hypothetical protein
MALKWDNLTAHQVKDLLTVLGVRTEGSTDQDLLAKLESATIQQHGAAAPRPVYGIHSGLGRYK